MRPFLSAALAALVSLTPVSALETPLILDGGSLAVTIDPGLGLATMVAVEQNGTRRLGWKHFLSDLMRIEKSVDLVGDKAYSKLRQGSASATPSVEEFIRLFPDKASKKDVEANRDALQKRVRAAEDAFWEKLPPFDGKVAGSFNGQYLMLVVPSRRALLFYENASEKLELRGWYNYGPLLYISTAWKSTPNPSELASQLTGLDEEQKKTLEGALVSAEGEVAQAAASEVWTIADGKNFLVVDTANRILFGVQFPGKKIAISSVRNLSADLLIPGLKTAPTDSEGIQEFAKTRAPLIKKAGMTIDPPFVRALVAASAAGQAAKATDLQANLVNGHLLMNFPAQRKLVSYKVEGKGNGIELISVRDTTYDAGLATIDRIFVDRANAEEALKEAEKASKKEPADCLRLVTMALGLDPEILPQVEKNAAIRGALAKTAEWEPLLAEAAKQAEAAKAKWTAIEAAAQADRDARKKAK